jgi:Arc/MetJ-type ribon-helix-helix transcriptional regulator
MELSMPPGRTKTSSTTTISVKIPLLLSDMIREEAERRLQSQSDVVRDALLARFEDDLQQIETSA